MSELRNTFVSDARFEHSFWLSVLRDHTDFIRQSLSPLEQEAIAQANRLHQEALLLIEQFAHVKGVEEMRTFSLRMVESTTRLLHFKQMLLDRQLAGEITVHLPPSLLDHMIREGQEYLQVIAQLLHGRYLEGAPLAIHEANLWLSDGSVHAALIRNYVDPQEQDIFESAHKWKTEFDALYLHLQEMQTKLRTNVRWTPSRPAAERCPG